MSKILRRVQAFNRRSAAVRFLPIVFFTALIAVWEVSVPRLAIPRFLLPVPSEIAFAFGELGWRLLDHVGVTAEEIAIGFPIGVGIGWVMGIAIAYSPLAKRIIYPVAISIKVTPMIALAPLLTLWLGFEIWSKVAIVALITFFPLVVTTAAGLSSVPKELVDLLRSLSANGRQVFLHARLPWALPHVFSGMKIGMTLSVVGAVIGELVGARKGLGFLLVNALSFIDTPLMFVVLISLTILGLGLFGLVRLMEKIVAPWTEVVETA